MTDLRLGGAARPLSVPQWRPFGSWALAVVLGAASTALGLLARSSPTFPGDASLTPLARDVAWFAAAARVITDHEHLVIEAAGVLLAGLMLWRRRRDLVLFAVGALGLRYLLELPKELVNRPRPAGDFTVFDIATDSSFPSGHVMTAVAFFGLWFVLAPSLLPSRSVLPVRVLAVSLVALTMGARMWAGVHWFSDVVGGVVWASAALAIMLALFPGVNGEGVLRRSIEGEES